MTDFGIAEWFRDGSRTVRIASVLAGIFIVWLLLLHASQAKSDADIRVPAFDYHCEERACQFWLTDPMLMFSSGLQFEWHLGDGAVSDKAAPLYHYPHDGHFRTELIVRGNDGRVLLRSEADVILGFGSDEPVGSIGTAFSGAPGSEAGFSVAGLGDFIANGLSDLIIGAPRVPFGKGVVGAAYVVFGDEYEPGEEVPLTSLDGTNGFRIIGSDEIGVGSLGTSVARLGTIASGVNRAAVFGAPGFSNQGPGPGQAFFGRGLAGVLYGSADPFPAQMTFPEMFDIDDSAGFAIIGPIGEAFGVSVAAAGDFNDNGFQDIVIGAPQGETDSSHPLFLRGRTYIIYGRNEGFSEPIDVANLGPEEMLVLEGAGREHQTGWSVAGVGDFNGNGFSDIIIGAPFVPAPILTIPGIDEDPAPLGIAQNFEGAAFVVFGGEDFNIDGPTVLDGDLLNGTRGFTIRTNINDQIGFSVAAVGDLNDNSSTDLAVSAPGALHPTNESLQGAVHVLFGGTGAAFGPQFNPQTSLNGSNGFSVIGLIDSGDVNGSLDTTISLGAAGDINGNGLEDLLIGLPGANGGDGRVVVIFGRSGDFPEQIDASDLQAEDGFVINGTIGGGRLGQSVAGLGDFVGNGLDDLVSGAPGGFETLNTTWVVAGQQTPLPPMINGGDGVADQQAAFTSLFEIEFEVSDVIDAPEDLIVQAFSENPDFLPDEALELGGDGAIRTLTIDTSQASPGTVPIVIVVTNTFDMTSEAVFTLQILEQPPLINDGEGFVQQSLFAGQVLEIEFTVSDLQDPPGDIQVTATSQTPNLIPPDGISILGTGGTRTLRVETVLGEGGIGQVDVEATNSFGLSTVEELVIVIDATPAPIINDGAGIDDQEMTAGESLEINFTVDDPEFGPDGIDIFATSGDTGVLPSEQLSILGSGTNRTLLIETFAGNIGTTPITIEARNSLDGVDSVTFGLNIVAAPPVINDGQPIDDAEVRGGESLTIDFQVNDPLDPAEVLEIIIESSNPELIPVEAISLSGTGNERTLVIETRPGTQGQSIITVTVINSNGQQDVREFLVEVFLVPTELDLAAEPFVLLGFPDLLVRLSAVNIGDEPAFGVLMAADIPEPFEAIGVFIESQGCLVNDGVVSCDDELLPAWECSLFEGSLVCQLESLEAEREAGVVLRLQGAGQAEMIALLEALNAPQVSTELDLDF